MPRDGKSRHHISQRNNEPAESKHSSSGINCSSQTCASGEACDNQSESNLENKVGAAEAHTRVLIAG
ncbi:hypothetical protein TNCV_85291 [Trichonephila clavipes]|nr:hypothetical protein TNCV_85291 [Trichonephila clavipes]